MKRGLPMWNKIILLSCSAFVFLGCAMSVAPPIDGYIVECRMAQQGCYLTERISCSSRSPSGYYWEALPLNKVNGKSTCSAQLRRMVSKEQIEETLVAPPSNVAPPQNAAPPGCRNDTECKGERVCENGRCVDRTMGAGGTKCVRDTDCPGDEICRGDTCAPPQPQGTP
jgi:hypothetical protein